MQDNSRIGSKTRKHTPEQQTVVELIREKNHGRQKPDARGFSIHNKPAFSVGGMMIFAFRYLLIAGFLLAGIIMGDVGIKQVLCLGVMFAGMSAYYIWVFGVVRFVRDLIIVSVCVLICVYLLKTGRIIDPELLP